MKNLKFENGFFVYDCEGKDCKQPDEPHRVSLNKIMAMLEVSLDEYYHTRDPRLEETFVLLSFLWSSFFDHSDEIEKNRIPEQAPWDQDLIKIRKELGKHYGHNHSHDFNPKDPDDDDDDDDDGKTYLN